MSYDGFSEPNEKYEEITENECCSGEEDTHATDCYDERTEYDEMCLENQDNGLINNIMHESEFTCDTCDRDFQDTYAYQKHMKEHIVCNIDGCTFTAHEKIVAVHIKTQHATGLYYKICNLSTPEDIKRWKEERKKHYPSKENIVKRQERQQEMLARGERLTKNKNSRKDKQKLKRVRQKNRSSNFKIKKAFPLKNFSSKKKSLINEQSDWNGSMCPFRGTEDLYKSETVTRNDTFEDMEWEQERPVNNKITITNALGILIGAYSNLSDDSDDEKPLAIKMEATNKFQVVSPESWNSDDEMPAHAPIAKLPLPIFENEKQNSLEVESPKFEVNSGCNKKKRKRVHNRKTMKLKGVRESHHRKDRNQKFARRRTTLLERLLENDIRHERNVLLQCVRYVVNKDYFCS